jgi:hypothetical protein
MLAGRMFAAKAPVKLSGGVWRAATVPSGWGAFLCEQSDGPVSTYRGSALLGHDGAGAPLSRRRRAERRFRRAVHRTRDHCLPGHFHVIGWATTALDEVRRAEWNKLRRAGAAEAAKAAKQFNGLRFPLRRNWEHLTFDQREVIAVLEGANRRTFRAWQLKEELRDISALPLIQAQAALDAWLAWASRSKLAPFVNLARTIRGYRASIEATIEWRLTNGIAESNKRLDRPGPTQRRPLVRPGPALPPRAVPEVRPHHARTTRPDPQRHRARHQQRPRRRPQHQGPAHRAPRLRLPLSGRRPRPRHARRRPIALQVPHEHRRPHPAAA